jgi:non-heme chloroperoxidase
LGAIMRSIDVRTADGLAISARETGKPAGLEIVFIHGMSQCSLAWMRQLSDSKLAAEFRMVAYDLRGHGASDKPAAAEKYLQDRLWAEELAAVIGAAGLRRPVLVGWSYAGRVISDYVRAFGTSYIAGINFVAAATRSGGEFLGPDARNMAGLLSDDLAINIAATRAFVHACFAKQPSIEELETVLAYNMVVPARVRAALVSRSPNPGDLLPKLALPVLVTHGTHDALITLAAGEFTASMVPNATLSVYQDIGHSPFFEDAPRFNHELAEFVRAANRTQR